MRHDCPNCGIDIEPDEFPYADGLDCPHCHLRVETDWESVDGDDEEWWTKGHCIVGRREP